MRPQARGERPTPCVPSGLCVKLRFRTGFARGARKGRRERPLSFGQLAQASGSRQQERPATGTVAVQGRTGMFALHRHGSPRRSAAKERRHSCRPLHCDAPHRCTRRLAIPHARNGRPTPCVPSGLCVKLRFRTGFARGVRKERREALCVSGGGFWRWEADSKKGQRRRTVAVQGRTKLFALHRHGSPQRSAAKDRR